MVAISGVPTSTPKLSASDVVIKSASNVSFGSSMESGIVAMTTVAVLDPGVNMAV